MATDQGGDDQEWEDVLVSSYDGRGQDWLETKKLPAKSEATIKAKAKLVVTQVITKASNKKLAEFFETGAYSVLSKVKYTIPNLRDKETLHSDLDYNALLANAPTASPDKQTLLDAIAENSLVQGDEHACFLGKSTVYPGGFLGAIGKRVVQLDGDYNLRSKFETDKQAHNVAELKDMIVWMRINCPVRFYRAGQLVHQSAANFNGYASRFTAVTKSYVYFRSNANDVVRIDAAFTETVVSPNVEVFVVNKQNELFWIGSDKGEQARTLCADENKQFRYLNDLTAETVRSLFPKAGSNLNPTLSLVHERYVAVALNLDSTHVFLHKVKDLSYLSHVRFGGDCSDTIYNIRVGKKVYSITPFVLRGARYFHAVGMYNNKVYYLTRMSVGDNNAFSLGNVRHQWIFGGYGRLTSFVLSFE